jgi:hypothetical protein
MLGVDSSRGLRRPEPDDFGPRELEHADQRAHLHALAAAHREAVLDVRQARKDAALDRRVARHAQRKAVHPGHNVLQGKALRGPQVREGRVGARKVVVEQRGEDRLNVPRTRSARGRVAGWEKLMQRLAVRSARE